MELTLIPRPIHLTFQYPSDACQCICCGYPYGNHKCGWCRERCGFVFVEHVMQEKEKA